jgi:AcrR family transcriptional regulator
VSATGTPPAPPLRQEILDAARDILSRDGYDGLSMRKVARRINHSATAIYIYFRDRDDLVSCVCDELVAGLGRELEEVSARHRDPLVALRKGLRCYVDFGRRHPRLYQARFSGRLERDPGPALPWLRRMTAECVARKKIAKVDPHRAGCALWAGVHGLTSLIVAMPGFEWNTPDKTVDHLIAMMLDGLK